jgi:surface antigen/Ni/Co efflux regulator RcnB
MNKLALGALALGSLASFAAQAQRYDNQNPPPNEYYRDHDARDQEGPRWSQGERLPDSFMAERFVFYGWRDNGLKAPPRGFSWRLIGNRFILADNRNGRIIEISDVPRRVDRGSGFGGGYGGDREQRWRQRYQRTYTYNDDAAYTECRNQPDPAGVLAGAFLGAIIGNSAAGRNDRTGATIAGVVAGGALGAALTSKLDCGDRSYAYRTYSQGFNGGRANAVYSWNNPQSGHRGEMRVLDYYYDEDDFRCAVFTQTVYIGGRPEEARGRACQQPDGTWAIID